MKKIKSYAWIGIIALIILSATFIFKVFNGNSISPNAIKVQVQKGSFKSLVCSTGQLEARKSVSIDVPMELSSRSVGIWDIKVTKLIEEGTKVDSGEWVASLDHSAVEEKLTDALTTLDEKMEQYQDAKIDTNINLSNLRDGLISSRIDLEEKELVLKQSVYESPAVVRQATLDVEKARRKLEQDQKNYKLKKQQDENKMKRVEMETSRVRKRIEEIEALFEAIDIKAPAPGMLIYGFDRTGSKIKVGSTVSRWEPKIAELPDLTSMISKTFINEVDISKIKKGQKVKIGVDAFPEKEFDGEVTQVANIGQVIPGGDTKVFEVTINVFGSDKDLRPAMTTSNTITSTETDDVIFIPLEAVFHNDSLSYVYKVDNPEKRQIVELGAENENFVEIIQGLDSGEWVLMHEPDFINQIEEVEYNGTDIYFGIKESGTKTDSIASGQNQPLTQNL